MSVEIDWKALTTGPDGEALALTIRDFIHTKFQDVPLPKFIRSVQVHSFEFGDEAPTVVLKDICDPLDEFYEDDDRSSSDPDDIDTSALESSTATLLPTRAVDTIAVPAVPGSTTVATGVGQESLKVRRGVEARDLRTELLDLQQAETRRESLGFAGGTHRPGLRAVPSFVDQLASPLLSRSSTPAVPGGTSNLSYFHTPLSAGISGTQTPLAAAAGAMHGSHPFPAPWSDYNFPGRGGVPLPLPPSHRREPLIPAEVAQSTGDLSTRPSTADTHGLSHLRDGREDFERMTEMPSPRPEPSPNDIQLVMHVKYSGHVRLALSAEILLDYPMSSFVSIPLQLTITGITFDGVAIVAHVRPNEESEVREGEERGRAHVCFLSQEDAAAVLGTSAAGLGDDDEVESPGMESPLRERRENAGDTVGSESQRSAPGKHEETHEMAGLLKEIRVESEIGQRQDGRQSLKNVGKVEKFVLEQVRRIFEDEFVWPSFWTFLI